MKAVCFRDKNSVSVESIDDPQILEATDAIVKVRTAGLCGSDLHVYHGRETGIDIPTALGHEFVGEVVDVGPEVKQFCTGQIVCAPFTTNCGKCFYCLNNLTCRCLQGQLFGWRQNGQGLHGGQAELVRVPLADATLFSADGLSHELALLLGDNLSTAFYCAELAQVEAGGTYAIVGCGTVGLIATKVAHLLQAEKLFAIDLVEHRLQLASQFGAETLCDPQHAIESIRAATGGRGADAVMELVGLPEAQKLAFQLVRPGGTIATIGCHCEPHFAFSPVDAYDKNLTYRSGRCPARYYMNRLRRPALEGEFDDLTKLVTHHFPLQQGPRAYEVFAQRQDNCVKAVLDI